MGLRAGLDRCGKSRLTGIRSPDLQARRQSLYRLSYPAHSLILRDRRIEKRVIKKYTELTGRKKTVSLKDPKFAFCNKCY